MIDLRLAKNSMLRHLSAAEVERLSPHFDAQPLAFKQLVFAQGKPVTSVYFVETGVISLVTDFENGETIEIGTVGNEGYAGLPAVLGVRHAPGRAFCQVPGGAVRISAEAIAGEREASTPWFQLLLRYANFVTAMIGQTAGCNRMHSVEARMSRWLLMTHDRVMDDDFPLTQEFLGQMLGVPRPTVNLAGAMLQKAGFIKYTRGRVTILDREGLESASCECYQRIRQELDDTLKSGR